MTARISLLLALMLVTACSTTAPSSPAAANAPAIDYLPGPGPYDFDCDAPTGTDRQASIRLPNGPWRARGQLQFLTTRDDPRWEPTVLIHVLDSKSYDVLLVLWVYRGDHAVRMVFATAETLLPDDYVMGSMRLTSAQVPFELVIDPAGKISASVGGVAMPVSLKIAGSSRLMLQCSTARVRFSNVTLEKRTRAVEQPIAR